MAKKPFKWTAARLAKLLAIPFEASNYRRRLQTLAERWHNKYHTIYNRWYYEHTKLRRQGPQRGPDDIAPIPVLIDPTAIAEVDAVETKAIQIGLDRMVPELEINYGAAIIEKRFEDVAVRHLGKQYPKKVFIISPAPDNPRMSRIFRKA